MFEYVVCGLPQLGLTEALRLWRTKYDDFKDFNKEVIEGKPGMKDFGEFVYEMWDKIQKVTVTEALALENAEKRRVYFDCIGVETIFKQMEPTLRDRQVIKKKRMRWDTNNDPYDYEFEDVYELYEIEGEKLFGKDRWNRMLNPVYAVRCWCTTTNREYWLYVSPEAVEEGPVARWGRRQQEEIKYDAISAIAWTIRIDISHPERIYRQGDIIVAKMSDQSETVSRYHLTKENYLELMYSET